MDKLSAAIILLFWIIIPTLHVAFGASAGTWAPLKGSKCPFGPRVGWMIIVLMLGLIGWGMFLRSRKQKLTRT